MRRLTGQGPAGAPGVAAAAGRAADTLDELLPALARPRGRPRVAERRAEGGLIVPLGIVDKPFEQRRDILYRRLLRCRPVTSLVVGGPAVRQVDAAAHDHGVVRAHATRRGSRSSTGSTSAARRLASLQDLPHVGGSPRGWSPRRSAVRSWPRCRHPRRAARSTSARTASTRSPPTGSGGRRARADQAWGDVFLVIDGWGNFRNDYEELERGAPAASPRAASATASTSSSARPGNRGPARAVATS